MYELGTLSLTRPLQRFVRFALGRHSVTHDGLLRTIADRNLTQRVRVHALDTSYIESDHAWWTPLVVMRVDSTGRAEEVLSGARIPLIRGEFVGASDNREVAYRNAGHDRTFAFAQCAIAAPKIRKAVSELDGKCDRAAMAGSQVLNSCHSANLTVELSGAAADVWAWHFIPHASAPAIC